MSQSAASAAPPATPKSEFEALMQRGESMFKPGVRPERFPRRFTDAHLEHIAQFMWVRRTDNVLIRVGVAVAFVGPSPLPPSEPVEPRPLTSQLVDTLTECPGAPSLPLAA